MMAKRCAGRRGHQNRRWRFLLPVFLCLLAGVPALWAHSDPWGDVRPMATVEGGKFVVRAYNNVASDDTGRHLLDLTFDRCGQLIKKRRRVEPPLPDLPYGGAYSYMDRLPEEHNGLERQWGDKVLIIPEWWRKHEGAPFVIADEGTAFQYHPLHWKNTDVRQVVDACIVKDRLYLLVTRADPEGGMRLNLHRFSLETFSEEASIELPRPCLIWSFPVCSNMIEHQGKVYLGVVTRRLFGFRLVLAGWDGEAAGFSGQTLTNRIDWNTTLSLAHIGRHALMAYHYPGADWRWLFLINPPHASIRTVSFELE
ncbi:MAG TPA: hypothetical protein VNQ90_07975 [Chthoniobacteraceae bacterium]|nr:hypothetical protein [Chthoniobacteraceae bacterium]